jgi:hypothetical protein
VDFIQTNKNLSLAICKANCYDTALESWTPDWPSLVERLSSSEIGSKDGSYFTRCSGTQRTNDGTANQADILIIDGDSRINPDGIIIPGAPPPEDVHLALTSLGVTHLIYTSHSNDLDYHKNRVVIPCCYSLEQLPVVLDSDLLFILIKK